jgi:carbamoyl-phosphate synthase large subunit
MQITAPAMAIADKPVVVPHVYSKNYVDIIIEICKCENVNAIISLNDLELPVLAAEKSRFDDAGVKLIISDEKVIDICFDKYKTILFGKQLGIDLPETYLALNKAIEEIKIGNLRFPLVVKPRWGSASVGIEFPANFEMLELSYRLVCLKISGSILYEASKQDPDNAVLIQEKINGTEYGLDILNDFSGRCVQVYVKEKLAMRAGETDKAILRNKPDLEDLGFRIGNALGHIGNLDCDIFESDGRYYLLEMNPRFGGGYPFSHVAGANYPDAICTWIEGKDYCFDKFSRKYNQPFAKCDTLIRVLK